ncbi:prominin-1-like isoform X1 [Dreissena polymorpha]|nr:prominin-1-like isoform X1 [Dreissena polymorpha]
MASARLNTVEAFKQMGNQTATMLSKIKDFQSNTKGSLNIASIKADVNTYADTAKTYDAYRQKGGLALSAMTTLIVVFLVLGVVFGTVGQGLRTPPTDRGCVSNSGGNLLMAGVAFIFIFSWLLMLLTMLCYILGGPMERFFCQSLADPELKLVKVMEKKWLSEDVKTAVGGSVTDVLQGCRDGKSAYLAFNLKTRFNISEIDEQLKAQKKNIDDQLNKTLANVANATGGMNDFDKTANASFTDLKTAFAAVQADELDKAIAAAQQIPIFGGIDLSGFKDATQNLKRVNASLQEWETKFVDGMKTASSQIQAKMPELVKDFQTKVMNIADNYVNSTKDKVINDVGKCTPVWNLYHSIVVVALCQYTIDSFNGFWFSIGWCLFFFMPSLVFGVKLAKHFRRMNPDDDEEGLHMGSLVPNKVAPAPDHHN